MKQKQPVQDHSNSRELESDSGDDPSSDSDDEPDTDSSDDGMDDENNIYTDENIPEHIRKADTLFHVTRLSALALDADEAEEACPQPTFATPTLKKIGRAHV